MSKFISEVEKVDYYRRLNEPTVRGEVFIDQYKQGSGNELEHKFWNRCSSSRMAFDLYSWIANVSGVKSFAFEKRLPGVICLASGTSGVPNMDVFFEVNDTLVFIESKYTEARASIAYKNGDLSKAYWYDGPYGRANFDLPVRFYNEGEVARRFSKFCDDMQQVLIGKKRSWFDIKQETCHLFGILFTVLCGEIKGTDFRCDIEKARELYRGKHVVLSNNVWGLSGDSFDEVDNSLVMAFKVESERLLNGIFKLFGIDCTFTFMYNKVQDLLKESDYFGLDFTKAIAYGSTGSVVEQMKQYECGDVRK